MKNLKQKLKDHPELLLQGSPALEREVRHLIFTGNDANPITIPLCGVLGGVAKRKTRGVTCAICKSRAGLLSTVDDYEEAKDFVAPYIPTCIVPDLEIMKERHGDMPTKNAVKHIEAANFLRNHYVTTPDDLYLRLLGTEDQFIWNMIELDLIDEEGDACVPVWE